ncbi:hypothetical protein CGC20_32045 [Leishmania donovani]|uniref:Uncharacterized protein n=1 Tax=Leishmania donovani TaxID=5661 RepID=A0A504XZ78_LEIDO|nr:hypothetical protein CGC20_32045 [Leishmania donovani]
MLSCSSNDADLFCFPHRNGDAAPTSPPSQPPLTQERLLALQQSASDRNLVALAPATTTALNTSERRTGTTVLGATHLGGDTDQVIRQRQERVMSWLAGSSTTPNPPLDNADDGAIDAALRGSGVPDGCTERASATDKVAGEQPQLQRRVLHAPSLVTTPVEGTVTASDWPTVSIARDSPRHTPNASGLGAVAFSRLLRHRGGLSVVCESTKDCFAPSPALSGALRDARNRVARREPPLALSSRKLSRPPPHRAHQQSRRR